MHLQQVSPFREYAHVLWKNSVSYLPTANYNTLLSLRTMLPFWRRIWSIHFFVAPFCKIWIFMN